MSNFLEMRRARTMRQKNKKDEPSLFTASDSEDVERRHVLEDDKAMTSPVKKSRFMRRILSQKQSSKLLPPRLVTKRIRDGGLDGQDITVGTLSISSAPLRNLRRVKSDVSLIHTLADSGSSSPHIRTLDQDSQNDDMRPSSLNSDLQGNKLSPRSLIMSDKLFHRDLGGKLRSSGGRASAKNDRNEFFSVFSLLIKLGNEHRSETKVYNRQISEDPTYPNYRDNLWLELQAWHNGRTISEQYEYLSSEREKVSPIIEKLLNFKYERIDLPLSDLSGPMPQCDGCLSIYCQSCLMHQSRAMKIVCDMLDEIEKIELLYPSSKAVGLNYPTYRSERFIGRLKSLCVWLNTIRTLRMRIDIVGSIFHNTSSKVLWPQWPVWNLSPEEEESDQRISTIKLMGSFSEPGNNAKSDGNDQSEQLYDTKEDIQVLGSGKIYRRSNSKVRFFLEEKSSDGQKDDKIMDDILSNLMEVQSERSTNTPTTTSEPAPWTPSVVDEVKGFYFGDKGHQKESILIFPAEDEHGKYDGDSRNTFLSSSDFIGEPHINQNEEKAHNSQFNEETDINATGQKNDLFNQDTNNKGHNLRIPQLPQQEVELASDEDESGKFEGDSGNISVSNIDFLGDTSVDRCDIVGILDDIAKTPNQDVDIGANDLRATPAILSSKNAVTSPKGSNTKFDSNNPNNSLSISDFMRVTDVDHRDTVEKQDRIQTVYNRGYGSNRRSTIMFSDGSDDITSSNSVEKSHIDSCQNFEEELEMNKRSNRHDMDIPVIHSNIFGKNLSPQSLSDYETQSDDESSRMKIFSSDKPWDNHVIVYTVPSNETKRQIPKKLEPFQSYIPSSSEDGPLKTSSPSINAPTNYDTDTLIINVEPRDLFSPKRKLNVVNIDGRPMKPLTCDFKLLMDSTDNDQEDNDRIVKMTEPLEQPLDKGQTVNDESVNGKSSESATEWHNKVKNIEVADASDSSSKKLIDKETFSCLKPQKYDAASSTSRKKSISEDNVELSPSARSKINEALSVADLVERALPVVTASEQLPQLDTKPSTSEVSRPSKIVHSLSEYHPSTREPEKNDSVTKSFDETIRSPSSNQMVRVSTPLSNSEMKNNSFELKNRRRLFRRQGSLFSEVTTDGSSVYPNDSELSSRWSSITSMVSEDIDFESASGNGIDVKFDEQQQYEIKSASSKNGLKRKSFAAAKSMNVESDPIIKDFENQLTDLKNNDPPTGQLSKRGEETFESSTSLPSCFSLGLLSYPMEDGFKKAKELNLYSVDNNRTLYHPFVEQELKSKGLRKFIEWIDKFNIAMFDVTYKTLLPVPKSCEVLPEEQRNGSKSEEFLAMSLPSYESQYIFICRIPLILKLDCMNLYLDQVIDKPSVLSLKEFIKETKFLLTYSIKYKLIILERLSVINFESDDMMKTRNMEDLSIYNDALKKTFQVYTNYLKQLVAAEAKSTESYAFSRYILEDEWTTYCRQTAVHVPKGEVHAGVAFAEMASELLHAIGPQLYKGLELNEGRNYVQLEEVSEKQAALDMFRHVQKIFFTTKERALQMLSFVRELQQDLKRASEFQLSRPPKEVIKKLLDTGHVRVETNISAQYRLYVPGCVRWLNGYIMRLMNLECFWDERQNSTESTNEDGYLIVLNTANQEVQQDRGEAVVIKSRKEHLNIEEVQCEGLFLITDCAQELPVKRRFFQKLMGDSISLVEEARPAHPAVAESLHQLKAMTLDVSQDVIGAIEEVEKKYSEFDETFMGEPEHGAILSRGRETLNQCYKFGFEYYRELQRLNMGRFRSNIGENIAQLAQKWMRHAIDRCERGRGVRPKWAHHGLNFLTVACDPKHTRYLSDSEFEEFKKNISECLAHVIGTSDDGGFVSSGLPSPQRRSLFASKGSRCVSDDQSDVMSTSEASYSVATDSSVPRFDYEKSMSSSMQSPTSNGTKVVRNWQKHVAKSVSQVDDERDSFLQSTGTIGKVKDACPIFKVQIKSKTVNFPWQRGVKIGQGRFGKVFVAINTKTGEVYAMKEIPISQGDHRSLRKLADELRIFEGIKHKNLVRHYGVEIHKDEMLIFMEYCSEGTLESLIEQIKGPLPEMLIRRYSRQLLEAVRELHEHGIAHRDIKSANIFLTEEGNCLKLGDYGCAAKIKSHTTVAGELHGFVGTQAYMAPEVFMSTAERGHGRAADIWSVGCVVVEMTTGKRPWPELESNYAIMFRVGMGEHPEPPVNLSAEGKDFIGHCLTHDQYIRWTASQLLEHQFVKVGDDL